MSPLRGPHAYLAGPITGQPDGNQDAFDEAADYLARCGYIVFNPIEHDRQRGFDWTGTNCTPADQAKAGFSTEAALRDDLDWITRFASHLVLLPGWSTSKGSLLEKQVAEACGIAILYLHPEGTRTRGRLDTEPLLTDSDAYLNAPTYQAAAKSEVRSVNAETGGEKGVKPERYDLIPVGPLAEVARVYGFGATKYDDRNWERGYDWSKSYAALQRHVNAFWGGDTFDDETGLPHLAHAVFHCLAMIEWYGTHPELDDRATVTLPEAEATEFTGPRLVVDQTCPPDTIYGLSVRQPPIRLEVPERRNALYPPFDGSRADLPA
jgi:hypothetical protein